MYTSDTKKDRSWIGYLIASAVVFICSMVYEHFSHGVYSAYMLGAFLVPLFGGALPCFLLRDSKKIRPPLTSDFQLAAVATLTMGSLLQGALEIYGTSNRLMAVYPILGFILAGAAISLFQSAKYHGRDDADQDARRDAAEQ